MDKIPPNVLTKVLSYLDFADFGSCLSLNKHWRRIMDSENDDFWASVLNQLKLQACSKYILPEALRDIQSRSNFHPFKKLSHLQSHVKLAKNSNGLRSFFAFFP